jgi:hypothetical protein
VRDHAPFLFGIIRKSSLVGSIFPRSVKNSSARCALAAFFQLAGGFGGREKRKTCPHVSLDVSLAEPPP